MAPDSASRPTDATLSVAPPLPPPDRTALRLGYAGLVPFVACALFIWLLPQRPVEHAFVADAMSKYAALVASFLGGVHWGLGMARPAAPPAAASFAWAVAPAVLGWSAALMPPYAALPALGALLVACYAVDRRRYPVHGLAAWLTLRFRLTAVASLSCFLAAAGS
jgi:hypothetical protein